MKEVSSTQFAEQARSSKYDGVPYTKLDCQRFVEEVLKDCGVRKADGTPYNWKGSNSMWRNALAWRGSIAECLHRYGEIPLGAWVFIIKNDGGEKEKGYNDNDGNASHVGIYARTGDEPVRDSTRGTKRNGVGYRSISAFTHVGLPYMIDYTYNSILPNTTTKEEALEALEKVRAYIERS